MLAKSPDRTSRVLMDGIMLGECPRWHDGKLWFADWVGQTLYSVDETGRSNKEAHVASLPFSIDWLDDGTMLVVNAAERLLQKRQPDGSFATYADLRPLSPYGSNEIVVDGRSNAYLNNVNFDMSEGGPVKGYEDFLKTGDRPGFIALVTPDGAVRKVAEGLAFPNGMAVTPDNKTLIVAESYSGALTAFDIAADGALSNRRVWAQLEGGGADGICLDAEGCVWAGSMGNAMRVREGGEIVDEVSVPDGMACFAVMLGGADGRTLFSVANAWSGDVEGTGAKAGGKILATRVDIPHAGYPRN
jgi:sugar lactone lactonase YvrE